MSGPDMAMTTSRLPLPNRDSAHQAGDQHRADCQNQALVILRELGRRTAWPPAWGARPEPAGVGRPESGPAALAGGGDTYSPNWGGPEATRVRALLAGEAEPVSPLSLPLSP